MSTQNDWLSNYFGDDVAEDLEKTAQAHLLVKLAEQAGLDINQLSEEELMQLVAELQMNLDPSQQQGGQPGGQPGMTPGGAPGLQPGQPGFDMNPTQPGGQSMPGRPMGGVPNPMLAQQRPQQPQGQAPQQAQPQASSAGGLSPEMAKEAQAKFEEADALGRVMAHAYVEELDKIASVRETEKTAGSYPRGGAGRLADRASHAAGSAANKAKEVAGKARDFAKGNKKAIGAGAAAAGAGFAAGRMSKKASVAFEKLANDRAIEILQTLGIDPNTGQQVQQDMVPEQQGQPDFGQALDQRALQLLSDAGYDPNAVATAYDQQVGAGGGEVPQQ
jgi:hypothetical protein